ncbi:Uncharacterized protein cmbei_5003603, partial [Cryptosporidium meleagridis]
MLINFSIFFILLFGPYLLNDLSIGRLLLLHQNLNSGVFFNSQNCALIKLKASSNDQDLALSSSELGDGATGSPKSGDGEELQSVSEGSLENIFLYSGNVVNFDKSLQPGPCKFFPDLSRHQTEPCIFNPSKLHPTHISSCGEKVITCYECESKIFPQSLQEWTNQFEHEACKHSSMKLHVTRTCGNGQKIIFCSGCQRESDRSLKKPYKMSTDFSNSLFFFEDDLSGTDDCPCNPGNSHPYYFDFRGIKHVSCFECENSLSGVSIEEFNERKNIEPCHRSEKGFHLVERGPKNNKFIYCTSCSNFYNFRKTSSTPKCIFFKDQSNFELESCPCKRGLVHKVHYANDGFKYVSCFECIAGPKGMPYKKYAERRKFERCPSKRGNKHLVENGGDGFKLIYCTLCYENCNSKASSQCEKLEEFTSSDFRRESLRKPRDKEQQSSISGSIRCPIGVCNEASGPSTKFCLFCRQKPTTRKSLVSAKSSSFNAEDDSSLRRSRFASSSSQMLTSASPSPSSIPSSPLSPSPPPLPKSSPPPLSPSPPPLPKSSPPPLSPSPP